MGTSISLLMPYNASRFDWKQLSESTPASDARARMSLGKATVGVVAKYSRAQLGALARIKFAGLIYFHSGPHPMTYLNTPMGFTKRVNAATVRRLEADGLIERDPEAEDDMSLWRVSSKGEALLRENREYLEPAGREAALVDGEQTLARLGIRIRRED
jgi:DNA-binding MarR family transcriptional regulator